MFLLGETSTALKVIVDILGVLGILVFGTFMLVFLVDLILSGVDGHKGIFFNRKSPDETYNPVSDEPVQDSAVMYYQNDNPNTPVAPVVDEKPEGNVTGVDFDKAIEEQKQLIAQNPVSMWDDEDDEEEGEDISEIIDTVTRQALKELDAENATKTRKVYKIKTPQVQQKDFFEEEPIMEEVPVVEEVVEQEPVVDEEKLALERKIAELEEQRKQDREELLKTLQELKEKEPVVVEKEDNDKKYANIARMNARLNSIKKTTEKLKEKKEEKKVVEPQHEVVTTVVEETVVHEPIEETVVVEPQEEIVVEEKVVEVKHEKPRFKKEYYENRLQTLEADLKEAQKELKANNKEYLPIVKVKKAYDKDSEKLRRKEAQVAKQKVAIYGVNKSGKINDAKRQKLEENVQLLKELKDSVFNCLQVIEKNKDRFPILEKNNKLITKQVKRLQDDIASVKEALKWYEENSQD